ncbi:oplophorus-luciferin 2-monooxygenase non-catalytic subunit-like [Cherax quadricarinatus]|uniref:oplophorus-luciferin 2-monooxygenase non-catalytic subunit-like n=1 Tax=Cherax quadricarinatus TaxID=27406 RepID=UPI00387E295B
MMKVMQYMVLLVTAAVMIDLIAAAATTAEVEATITTTAVEVVVAEEGEAAADAVAKAGGGWRRLPVFEDQVLKKFPNRGMGRLLVQVDEEDKTPGFPVPVIRDLLTTRKDNHHQEARRLLSLQRTTEGLCVPAEDIWPCECSDNSGSVVITCIGVASAAMIDRALSPEYPNSNMTRLSSMYSALGHLHKEILHGKSFEELDLTSSSIDSVEEGAFSVCQERLTSLMLTTNSLNYFPFKELPLYPKLVTLSVGGNQLTSLDELVGLPELPLTVLYLGNNLISSLHPQVFYSVPHLSVLDLHKNNLTSLPPEVFTPLTELQILYLYKNNIKHLAAGSLWFTTPILRALDLRSNHLEVVESDVFRGVDYSTQVSLDYNKVEHMMEEVFSPLLSNVSTEYGWLSIMGMKLVCDCDVLWIISQPRYMDHLLFAVCTNHTSLSNLSEDELAEDCATDSPLEDDWYDEEEEAMKRRDNESEKKQETGYIKYGWWWLW